MKSYRVLTILAAGIIFDAAGQAEGTSSVARQWNEENLAAIRIDIPHPPVHARNLFHTAAAMYDAWAAYDDTAIGYFHHERLTSTNIPAARNEAISYAAYRVLKARYADSANASATMEALNVRMDVLGYDTNITTTVGSSPAGLGNRIAASILEWGLSDRSGETNSYVDTTYTNTQPEFAVISNGIPLGGYPDGSDPDIWHPLTFDEGFAQNGVGPIFLQPFIGATWLWARPFALRRLDPGKPWYDPGPPNKLLVGDPTAYRQEALKLLEKSRLLGDMELVDISPASMGNNPLGTDDGTGYSTNPITGSSYIANYVPRGDYGRVLSEFWADGPDSETPPGHWHVMANDVTDLLTEKRIEGMGSVVDDLEWDVKLYFALAASTHDAACAAWALKRYYDSPRPISMIRYMSKKGQSTDSGLPSYHPEGIPLVAGLVAVVTTNSIASGGEHEALGFEVGDIVVFTWPGRPIDPTTERNLSRWIRGIDWFPYQERTFVSPAFPGYVSGHSTFSRAAAEVLAAFTGSEYFPGGMGSYTLDPGYLFFEYGPSTNVQLQWATYYDAADEAGISRRWGGIHPVIDDLPARIIGADCGSNAYALASQYWDGSIVSSAMHLQIQPSSLNTISLNWNSVPGLEYAVKVSESLGSGWSTLSNGLKAIENQHHWADPEQVASNRFYIIEQNL